MNRRGFSLLELVVALSLSVLLLAGIYAGLDLFWRYSTTGQEEIERAQIARAVLRQIESDLRGIVFKPGEPAGQSSGGSSTGATAGQAPTAPAVTPGTEFGGTTQGDPAATSGATSIGTAQPVSQSITAIAGLVGDFQSLKLTTSNPARGGVYAPLGSDMSGVIRTSDMLTVGYQLGDSVTSTAAPTGLGRFEGDRLQASIAEAQGDVGFLSNNMRVVAPEVTALQFAYFDGYNWLPEWDSSSLGGLPTAVEVIIEVTTPPRGSRPGIAASKRNPATQAFRLVVALPLAKATDTLSTQ
ncbi:MAG: prepilin-type N-terminal cleavage/methylation domain-containing protein [Planctomycetaceae bacterium]